MVAPGFLQNPEVRRWLNGVEPAWTALEFNSLNALRHEPSTSNHAIHLEPDLADAEIYGSAVTANELHLFGCGSVIGRRVSSHLSSERLAYLRGQKQFVDSLLHLQRYSTSRY